MNMRSTVAGFSTVVPLRSGPDRDPSERSAVDMEPDVEIEVSASNVAVHWGSPDNLVEHLVELAAERKVYVRPTSAGIAAEAELVLPGSTRAVRTTEPLAAPAHQVHIHVAGPEGLTDLQEAPH